MAALNLKSTTGIIYIILIIIAVISFVGIVWRFGPSIAWRIRSTSSQRREDEQNNTADLMRVTREGGKRRKLRRQRK